MGQLTRSLVATIVALSLSAAIAIAQSAQPNFSISIGVEQNKVRAGSDLAISVVETNVSNHPIWLGGGLQPLPGTGIVLEVLDVQGVSAPKTELYRIWRGEENPPIVFHPAEGGKPAWTETHIPMLSGRGVLIDPGNVVKDQIVVNKLFDLSKPGKYTIRLRQIDFRKDEEASSGRPVPYVNSNTITITITP